MKVAELVRLLEQGGWQAIRQSGSHKIFKNPTKSGRLVVPIHGGKDVPKGLLERILRDAGLK